MNMLVVIFWRYDLVANVVKSLLMTCQPGALGSQISADVKALEFTGVVDLYCMRLRRRIPFLECGVELTEGSMSAHCSCMHGAETEIYWNLLLVSQTEHCLQVYNVRFLRSTKRCPWPFPGWPGSSHTWNGLRLHFDIQHWGDRIRIPKKHMNLLLRCVFCRSQVPAGRLNTQHYASENCSQGEERRHRQKNLQRCFEASRLLFQINAEALPPSEDFLYFGRKITQNKKDWTTVYQNLRKAKRWWVMCGDFSHKCHRKMLWVGNMKSIISL